MSQQVTVFDQVRNQIDKMGPQFKAALPAHVDVKKFQRVAMTAIQQSPDLLDADRRTLFGACMRAAQDGLLPDGREGAIVTRKGAAVWMPMAQGIMKKVRNSGEISTWSVQVVKANDEFDYQLGDDEKIFHRPSLKDRGATIGAYSIVSMKDGTKSREFMALDEICDIMKRSDGYKYAKQKNKDNPWITHFDEMAKKTVVRRHAKRLPMSTDLDEFIRQDDELFTAAPAEPKDITPEPEKLKQVGRPSRLQSLVDDDAPPVHDQAPDGPESQDQQIMN